MVSYVLCNELYNIYVSCYAHSLHIREMRGKPNTYTDEKQKYKDKLRDFF